MTVATVIVYLRYPFCSDYIGKPNDQFNQEAREATYVEAVRYWSLRQRDTILPNAFERFNVGTDAIANLYRERGNRSLSVGDIVVIDDEAWVCHSLGWNRLPDFTPTTKEANRP